MANRRDKRLDDLEGDMGGGDETKIVVNWRTDDLMEDDDGNPITVEAWKKKYPDRKLKIINTDDCWD